MVVRANGILHGRRIDLDGPVSLLPDGAPVEMVLTLRDLPLAEKHRMVDELCGSWKDDSSLGPIFDAIAERRSESNSRPIGFDDPS